MSAHLRRSYRLSKYLLSTILKNMINIWESRSYSCYELLLCCVKLCEFTSFWVVVDEFEWHIVYLHGLYSSFACLSATCFWSFQAFLSSLGIKRRFLLVLTCYRYNIIYYAVKHPKYLCRKTSNTFFNLVYLGVVMASDKGFGLHLLKGWNHATRTRIFLFRVYYPLPYLQEKMETEKQLR